MRVCDYIAQRLYNHGITKVYGLVGGSTAGLNDGFIKHTNIDFICFHHEQGAGHAAVGAARTNNKLSVCNVTAGCGVTNTLTSLLNAYEESSPVLFLSGNTAIQNQAKHINALRGIHIRKYGIQDLDVLKTVSHITKYSVAIESAEDVPYELEKAIHIALEGRPGPVWIDIPGNIQSAIISEGYKTFTPDKVDTPIDAQRFFEAFEVLRSSKRPLVIAGNGVNLGNARDEFKKFIDTYKMPFVTTFLSRDLIEYEHVQNLGMLGIKGARAANFAMQNADCLLILGCSMNVTHIGYDSKTFSPYSKKIMIDIDANELQKGIFNVDLPINCDIRGFLNSTEKTLDYCASKEWTDKCLRWKDKWPIYIPEVHRSDMGGLNLYEIVESLNRNMQQKDCFIVDAGQPCYILSTNGKYKQNCRFMAQAAQGDMGYAIPASVGAHFANTELNLIIVIGEGSFYTNMQELAVIRQHNIPVKIFVINNDGYMSIKQTQDKFFGARRWGVSGSTGVFFADIAKVASSFNIKYFKISTNEELDKNMKTFMRTPEPVIVEFQSQNTLDVLPAQAIKPDGSQGGLHDMYPFLSTKVLNEEMIVNIE